MILTPSKTTTTERIERRNELERRARARRALLWRKAEFDIELFVRLTSPQLEPVPHLGPLDEALDASMKKPLIILVEAPPRHGKTFRIEHHCARRLRYRPTENVAYASYAASFANRRSRSIRKIAARAGLWTKRPDHTKEKFEDPAAAVAYWQTQMGGAFVAGGRKGGFVGEGFGFIAVDDPFKNRDEAESEVVSQAVFEDLFQGTLFQRLEPGGSLLITHQPWNLDDLIERCKNLFKAEGIEHEVITLPAVKRAKFDSSGRLKSGVPLWKKRFDIKRLRRIQAATGAYNFDSQYMCTRNPKGKRIFVEPRTFNAPKRDDVIVGLSLDPGIVNNVKKDPSSYILGAGYLDKNRNVCIDILHAQEEHEELPETVDRLEQLFYDFPINGLVPTVCIVEEVSAFQSVSQIARRLDAERVKRGQSKANLPITSWVPEGSKMTRALPVAGAVGFGRVRSYQGKPWVPALHEQLKRFTGRDGGKDGLVDALSQFYDYLERALILRSFRGRSGGERVSASMPY